MEFKWGIFLHGGREGGGERGEGRGRERGGRGGGREERGTCTLNYSQGLIIHINNNNIKQQLTFILYLDDPCLMAPSTNENSFSLQKNKHRNCQSDPSLYFSNTIITINDACMKLYMHNKLQYM